MRRILPDRPLTVAEIKARYNAAHPERVAAYRDANRDTLALKQRTRAEKDRAGELARVKAWQAANPERHAATQEAIQQRKTDAQECKAGRPRPDLCEVCAEPSTRRLAFDHCHDKGHFRGWICHRCNLALGLVKDSPTVLRKLADYLIEDAMRQPFDHAELGSDSEPLQEQPHGFVLGLCEIARRDG